MTHFLTIRQKSVVDLFVRFFIRIFIHFSFFGFFFNTTTIIIITIIVIIFFIFSSTGRNSSVQFLIYRLQVCGLSPSFSQYRRCLGGASTVTYRHSTSATASGTALCHTPSSWLPSASAARVPSWRHCTLLFIERTRAANEMSQQTRSVPWWILLCARNPKCPPEGSGTQVSV